IQVKATEKLKKLKGNELFVFDLSIQDIVNWLDADAYVLLVIYEARADVCYFVDIEDYFGKNRHELAKGNKFVRVYFSKEANFDQIIVEKFKQHNDRIWKNPTGL
ncbi:MAG: DUF4365 domain-containing protein, partial [Saprospiraceae bacterium]|nr:DUF4365 domain-containing protein [Saprospiraceae bacterium]